ncbi:MAG TPA: DegV family protein [Anaerolineaceae bacterium]|nr:DegV family protein [Anaerolineaceae bacterium]
MNSIEIITDSCSDLTPELIRQFNLRIVPLQVYINGTTYQDGDLPVHELFALVEKTGELPKTSAPLVPEFARRFESADCAVFIGISSRLSATCHNALLAAGQFPGKNITVIDSLNLSTGIGMLALLAAEMRDAGCSQQEIAAFLLEARKKVRTSFTIDSLEYLHKGGRCSAMQAVVSSLLSIRPVITAQPDGTLGIKAKIRGSRKKALNSMLADFAQQADQIDLRRVFVTHTGCHDDARYLMEEIAKIAPVQEVLETVTSATVASHCGPNTISILYMVK